jgi:hypothetical protein
MYRFHKIHRNGFRRYVVEYRSGNYGHYAGATIQEFSLINARRVARFIKTTGVVPNETVLNRLSH